MEIPFKKSGSATSGFWLILVDFDNKPTLLAYIWRKEWTCNKRSSVAGDLMVDG